MAVSSRRATTIFDRVNSSIIDIIDFSDPEPMNYTADDFFTFYDQVFHLPKDMPGWNISTQYFFLLSVESFLGYPTGTENGTGNNDLLSRLQDFLATPVFLYNNVVYKGGPTPDMGTQASLGYSSYRVNHSLSQFFVFELIGVF